MHYTICISCNILLCCDTEEVIYRYTQNVYRCISNTRVSLCVGVSMYVYVCVHVCPCAIVCPCAMVFAYVCVCMFIIMCVHMCLCYAHMCNHASYLSVRIRENVHSSHIQFLPLRDPWKPQGMIYRFETFKDDKGMVVLHFLKVFIIPIQILVMHR